MKVKYIETFVFDQAQYRISNKSGEETILTIDYKNNQFSVPNLTDKSFQTEIEEIAKDLLSRKHNVNFAEK